MLFSDLNLSSQLLQTLSGLGYEKPTPIQEQAIPVILNGKDIFGCAQTGTGKTAAFALPMLQMLHATNAGKRNIRALILAPTRELAGQIDDNFAEYGKGMHLNHAVIYGGVSQTNQVKALQKGTDILTATPGRLLDLIQQGYIKLSGIELFVLDEADRMLDMGFIHDVKKIIALLPAKRQTLFFSATITPDVKRLSESLLTDAVRVNITPVSPASDMVEQSVYYVEKEDKRELLNHLLSDGQIENALIFTRTRRNADKVAKALNRNGIKAEAIHGDKSQGARQRILNSFREKSLRVLVATDLASRGIDVDKLSHVINFEIPETAETYVHRIGRTGRAGWKGTAISFCARDEKPYLKNIGKFINKEIKVVGYK